MKCFINILSFLILFGCNTNVTEEDIANLSGYWEIEQVKFPDGEVKEFAVNPTIDYIELNGLEGFRKKVHPKFDGTFEASDDAEYFRIEKNTDGYEIHYNPNMALHPSMHPRESLISISENSFSVISWDTLTYTYKRFQPINVTD